LDIETRMIAKDSATFFHTFDFHSHAVSCETKNHVQ